MSHTTVVDPGRVLSWRRKGIKQQLLNCLWDQLSNRFSFNQTVPGAGDREIPKTVFHKVSDSFNEGEYKTTMLSLRKPNATAIIGPNSAEGKEYKNTTKIVSIFYNVQRFPMAMKDRSVAGRTNNFYKIAEATADVISTLMAEQTDYDTSKAVIEGAEVALTDSAYWENSEYGSEISVPLSQVLHPNIYMEGVSAKNTWNTSFATAVTSLATAVDTEMTSSHGCGLASLDRIHLIASRTIAAIGGMAGVNEIKWCLVLSDAQWYQLSTESTTGWRDLLKYTEKGMDRMINGFQGVYKNMAIFVNQRQPLFNISGSTAGAFQYITPASDGRTRVAKGSNTGTLEVAMLLGAGALGMAEIEELDYEKKGFDYNFNTGMCGTRTKGTQRIDLDSTVAATSARVNESSFLYCTSTTTATV
jgi:hypothetical protein